jgi:putative flippase GtrA
MFKIKLEKIKQEIRELVSYGIFGVLSTLLNYGSYFFLTRGCHLAYFWANIIALILAKSFAFVANKQWVFKSKDWSINTLRKELIPFFAARLFSALIDILGLWFLVSIAAMNDLIAKIIVNIVVIAINYVISKFIIFRSA